jgi:peptidoglycan hydrolase-like protein with peptidoglycan-binding domain
LSTRRILSVVLSLGLMAGAAYARTPQKSKSKTATAGKSHHKTRHRTRRARRTSRRRGQQAMAPSRVREIQAALIRENFLDGQPNGVWDSRSKQAMQRYQQQNGWQIKIVPDSRALIKLGLGPDRANLINPDTAAVSYIPGGGGASEEADR